MKKRSSSQRSPKRTSPLPNLLGWIHKLDRHIQDQLFTQECILSTRLTRIRVMDYDQFSATKLRRRYQKMRFLLPARLIVSNCNGPSIASHSPARSRRIVLLLCALAALSATCLASEPRPTSVSQLSNIAVWDQGAAIADLDGDGHPDLAIVRESGSNSKGFQYQVELHLTTRVGPNFFSVSAEKGGLRIVPRDVDGDRDLDLVITGSWSHAPVGVWVNDSHGEFTQGDQSAYPRSIWTESSEIFSYAPQHMIHAILSWSYRFWVDSSVGSYFSNELLAERLPRLAADSLPTIAVSQLQTRGPPSSLPR